MADTFLKKKYWHDKGDLSWLTITPHQYHKPDKTQSLANYENFPFIMKLQ